MTKRSLTVVALSALASIHWISAQQQADTILYNGKVLTVDRQFQIAEAVAIRGGKIEAVGTNDKVRQLAGPGSVQVDLQGRTVIPGLIHTHIHVQGAEGSYGGDLPAARHHQYPISWKGVSTKQDILKQISDIIAAFKFKPGEWLYFSSDGPIGDQVKILFDELNSAELDKAAPNNPIAVSLGVPAENGHLVNGKAIEALWKRYGSFIEKYGRYWLDASGKPDGHLEPPASRLVDVFLPNPSPEDLAPLYRKGLEELSAKGVTTVSTRLPDFTIEGYKLLDSQGQLPVRIAYGVQSTFGIPDRDLKGVQIGAGSDMAWVASVTPGGVDGAGARMCIELKRDAKAAAALEEGQIMGLSTAADWWPRGQCHMDIEYSGGVRGARIKGNYYAEFIGSVARDNLRIANVHVSGDGSYSRILTELERLNQAKPGSVKGWGLDHCTLIKPKDVARAAKLGLMWSCQPLGEGNRAPVIAEAFGPQIANTYVATIKTMLDAGINVSLEGEWPGVEQLITRKDDKGKVWGPDQRVDRATALRIATQNGANYVLRGDKLGSIEPGKLADLAVLDRDFLTVPEEEISEIQSLLTIVGGKIIFVRTDFAGEQNLRPQGAVISTYQDLVKRRKRFNSSRS